MKKVQTLSKDQLLVQAIQVFLIGDAVHSLLQKLFPEEKIQAQLSRADNQRLKLINSLATSLGVNLSIFKEKFSIKGKNNGFYNEVQVSLINQSAWINFIFKELNESIFDHFSSHFIKGDCNILIICLSSNQYDQYSWMADFFLKKDNTSRFRRVSNLLFDNAHTYLINQTISKQPVAFQHVLLLKFDDQQRILREGQKVSATNWIVKKHFQSKYGIDPAPWIIQQIMRFEQVSKTCYIF